MKKKTRKSQETSSSSYEKDSCGSDKDNDSVLDVDFEFFNPRLSDVYTLRNLLRQLIGPDSDCLNIFELSELVASQTLVGSTVKMDGIEGDPLAFLSVVNLNHYYEKDCIKKMRLYIMSKISLNKEFYDFFCVSFEELGTNMGLILSERLINMPTQIVPPMYEMLFEEIEWALEDKEPYDFSYYIILSRSYQRMVDQDDLKKRQTRDQKKGKMFYFHQEDELFKEKSLYSVRYKYSQCRNSDIVSHNRDIDIQHYGEIMMISRDKLKEAINELKSIII
ncbi:hypothetical protein PNEG_00770 [Pneumocystis murina B123]|uniref:Protein BCP1 n=1 Tax=Pneumocystis murina (strain B123) TaxID=1069680 RepID=M7NVK5_PNEMU|nr:hypothetical protein PNEG_00770 [Pneumocystis murina B123]EMR11176.1 hypothetical protein PNEG_00770 [Pneumocystis murina B123]